ncbi:MAG TPA: serine/threonine-protein kinase [Polyangiaceae bacterium]
MSEADTLPPPPGYDRGLVAGKYRLTRQVGRGGMGTVWEGVHETLGTRVAVKLIESDHVQSPESLRRFENEAHAAARLQSKHVVEVYDHGVMADGRAFIVMQYLQGEPLERRLERLGRLSPRETARIVLQVCRALSKAHAVNIVHRDLKPDNVFLVWDEEDGADIVKVVDFGIAKFTDLTSEAAGTNTGSLLGTPFYMSPEQARGLRTVDHRSDLWSVGVIAFRCLVGRLPFEGESVGDVLVKLCTAPIPVPSEIVPGLPPGFDAWTARVFSREPAARFSSAVELGDALAQVCGLPARAALSTGDIPTRSSDPGSATLLSEPVFHPTYSNDHAPTGTTLASRNAPAPRPDVSIGGGLTKTPALRPRRSKRSLVLSLFLVLGALGATVVAFMKARPAATPAASASASPALPSATPAPSPNVSVAPAPAAESPQAPAPSSPVASAAASVPAAMAPRPAQGKAPRKKPPPAASSRTAPSLDIRLQR